MDIVLMAVFTALNFLPMRIYGPFYTIVTWWKVIVPVVAIIILFTKFNGANFSAGGGFFPTGVSWKDLFGALPGAGIVFAYLGFEQADQLAGEIKNPQKNLPHRDHRVDPHRHGHLHPAADRAHRRHPGQPADRQGLRRHRIDQRQSRSHRSPR